MFQTFTGSSRRPRQVNLSGKKPNPFATGDNTGGSQSALQQAQHDRLQRQRQKEELVAAKLIQRVWRSHAERQRSRRMWRAAWDKKHTEGDWDDKSPSNILACHQLLAAFAVPKKSDDMERASWASHHMPIENGGDIWPIVHRKLLIFWLRSLSPHDGDAGATLHILERIDNIIIAHQQLPPAVADEFFSRMSVLPPSFHSAASTPMRSSLARPTNTTYVALVHNFLTTPLDLDYQVLLEEVLDTVYLWKAAVSANTGKNCSPLATVWMLGNLIYLLTTKGARKRAPDLFSQAVFLDLISTLLGVVADYVDVEAEPLKISDLAYLEKLVRSKTRQKLPLNTYLHACMHRLIEEKTIRGIFAQKGSTAISTYFLTLLRVFDAHSDDIRMHMYVGSQSQQRMRSSYDNMTFFWKTARQSKLFRAIMQDHRSAISAIVYPGRSAQFVDSSICNEWKSVLLFLELYTFMLKVMDDEEFLGHNLENESSPQNPLSIQDNADLVTFLKHLGFTVYYYAQEIADAFSSEESVSSKVGVIRAFGFRQKEAVPKQSRSKTAPTLAGLPGIGLEYIKTLVTGLVRAIYERDSRRHFLPWGHWLMTSEFDMSNFITDVVNEEFHTEGPETDGDDDDHEGALPGARVRNRHYLKNIAPRRDILEHMPFLIPFDIRVQIFRHFVNTDKTIRLVGEPSESFSAAVLGLGHDGRGARQHVVVRRTHEFQDSMDQFFNVGERFKDPIAITFVDEYGIEEAGIDGGGVTKEFLTRAVAGGFDPEHGLFRANDRHLLYPNPSICSRFANKSDQEAQEMFEQYEYAGRLIGKCLYEGILVDLSFTGFFLKLWSMNSRSENVINVNDLRDLDEELYQGLLKLKRHQGEVGDLGLTFTVVNEEMVEDGPPKLVETNLIPNGDMQSVTNQNKLSYISKMAGYKLWEQSARANRAFMKGLRMIIQPSWLSMFNQSELQTLVGGAAAAIDVEDLRRNTIYGGLYVIGNDGLEHPCVQNFWAVMQELSNEDKGNVLKFVTSTPRAPLLGFKSLNPLFSIRDSGAANSDDRFPTASTCVNLLKLPRYSTKEALRKKLIEAVNSGAGFDLS